MARTDDPPPMVSSSQHRFCDPPPLFPLVRTITSIDADMINKLQAEKREMSRLQATEKESQQRKAAAESAAASAAAKDDEYEIGVDEDEDGMGAPPPPPPPPPPPSSASVDAVSFCSMIGMSRTCAY